MSADRFDIHRQQPNLGSGSYATVYEATDRQAATSFAIVAKVAALNTESEQETFRTERDVYRLLMAAPPHPHIVQCVAMYTARHHGILILERFKGTTLRQHIQDCGAMAEADMRHCLRQIVSAMSLHAKNIGLRDLKTENVSYDPETRTCQLFDFGLAVILGRPGGTTHGSKGSPLFMAPEVLQDHQYDPLQADYWTLGQLVYSMVTGMAMFGACTNLKNLKETVKQCQWSGGVPHVKDSTTMTPWTKALILQLCAYAPSKRWTLQHVEGWFSLNSLEVKACT